MDLHADQEESQSSFVQTDCTHIVPACAQTSNPDYYTDKHTGQKNGFVLFALFSSLYSISSTESFVFVKKSSHCLFSITRKDSDSAAGEIHHYQSQRMTQHGYNCIALQGICHALPSKRYYEQQMNG